MTNKLKNVLKESENVKRKRSQRNDKRSKHAEPPEGNENPLMGSEKKPSIPQSNEQSQFPEKDQLKRNTTNDISNQEKANVDATAAKTTIPSRHRSIPHGMFVDDPKTQKKVASKLIKQQVPKRQEFKVKMPLFSHLIQMERNIDMGESISLCNSPIHPDFISFGLKCADGILFSSRVRSIQLIECLVTFIKDYEMHYPVDAIRDLESKLSPSLSFLSQCRPNSVGMATIIKYLKQKLTNACSFEGNIKSFLIDSLHKFLNERIFMAGDVISTYVSHKIAENDVILTYSMSEIILNGLIDAYKGGKRFKVIIIDTLPRYDGQKMLRLLSHNDIKCCYVGFNSLTRVMRTVTKIIIFGNSLMSNGAVLCPVGSALIAAVGSHYRVPVLVCCETYNVSDRAQTDSFVYNELGDPDDILELNRKSSVDISDWKENPRITLLNLYYDIIQPKYVSAVVTELGIIPCSSAPVVLRVKS